MKLLDRKATTRAARLCLAVLALAGCTHAPVTVPERAAEVSIFALNDFHGHVQSAGPVPLLLRSGDAQQKPRAAGGLAYVASKLKQLRAASGPSVLVGMGDLIGATPTDSALLHDEPAITAMNQLGLSVSALGNHELDIGPTALKALLAGDCAPACATPDFHGAKFEYLAANAFDKTTRQPWLQPYAIREVGGYRIGFIGAVTRTTPMIVRPAFTQNLHFDDEADAINRVLPVVRAQRVDAVVVLIHEGGDLNGAAISASGDCPTLRGAITEILPRLDPSIQVVMTGHTHQAYVCKFKDRWVVQGGSYGGYVSEVKLRRDTRGALVPVAALLHEVAQDQVPQDAAAASYVASIQQLTSPIKNRVLGQLEQRLTRAMIAGYGDSMLGKWVANAQLAYAQAREPVQAAFMNAGGIRTDFGEALGDSKSIQITQGDVFAMQPFRNELVALSLSGAQLRQLLEQQAGPDDAARTRFLQPSSNVSYRWKAAAPAGQRVGSLMIDGTLVQERQTYRIVVNNFVAEGGDGYTLLTQARDRTTLGLDTDALIEALARGKPDLAKLQQGNIKLEP